MHMCSTLGWVAMLATAGCGDGLARHSRVDVAETSRVDMAETVPAGTSGFVPDADTAEFLELEVIEPYVPFDARRRTHETKQRGVGPIEGASMPPTPEGAELVSYRSNGIELQGWLLSPKTTSTRPMPAVVYLHNDFALTMLSFDNAKPFVEAGFPVFLPTWRAENGNEGDFELLFGEVDDAHAAIAWFAARPEIDETSVYVIGHSIGGGIAALLSLYPDLRARRTASVGGIYRARTFSSWARRRGTRRLIRFDPRDKDEVSLRLLGPNVRSMVHPHIAYAGRDDEFDRRYAQDVGRLAKQHGAPFEVVLVDGEHMSSIKDASLRFIQTIKDDLVQSNNASRR